MEPATAMPELSFRKTPRAGQWSVIEECRRADRNSCNVKLPTGYGKTLTACFVYALKRAAGIANRLLIIFPSDAQLDQFILDGERDLADAGVEGPLKVVDIRHNGPKAIKEHRNNIRQVFVITIQSLREDRGFGNTTALLETGQWMIVVDEYHHYGLSKTWGTTALALNRSFLLAMSATPERPTRDSAFGTPHVSVTYRQAVKEQAVKRLKAHAYSYRIEALSDSTNETLVFTTDELIKEAGGDSPEQIERLRIQRKMRWSPKYVSPLVQIPIERMLNERIQTSHKLQVLITAMCVSHARLVCEQVQAMFPELRSDWVGTGDDGRSFEDNDRVLKEFCPRKDEDGHRHPTLDVLVHVGMAGEGLDSVHVSEVVLLCNASICNRILQIIGRGARQLPGVICNVSFDSSSEFSVAKYLGESIMDAMDALPPQEDDKPSDDEDLEEPPELPENPDIHIANVELLNIDSGSEGVQQMAKVIGQLFPHSLDLDAVLGDLKHPQWGMVIDAYRKMRKIEAEQHDERAITEQWRDKVKWAVSNLASLVMVVMNRRGDVIEDKSKLKGEIKTKLNGRKKQLFGAVENDVELLKKHYGWCIALDRDIRERKSLPQWLS